MKKNLRIVSLLPSATEIIYAICLRENLVGVTHEYDFPQPVEIFTLSRKISAKLPAKIFHPNISGTLNKTKAVCVPPNLLKFD